jgi:uncharacterized protein
MSACRVAGCFPRPWGLLAWLFGLLAVGAPALGASLPISAGGALFSVPVTSFQEARFAQVVRQRQDFSCGSAALATLLSHHYREPTAEAAIFEQMYQAGDQEKIRREGFSLLDLQTYLAGRGYRADGFRVPLERLAEARVPAITLINDRGYRHFVVVKGLSRERVLIGDPARGLKTLPRQAFEGMWNGILFLIHNRTEIGQAHFNLAPEWGRVPPAPVALAALQQSAAPLALLLPPAHDL